jgi:RNA polymerase sigma-70 factor (ECF subfamily)
MVREDLRISFLLKTRRMSNCVGNIQPWTCSCFIKQRGRSTVIQASRSSSFSGRTGAAAVDRCLPVFGTQKRNARVSAHDSASSERQSSVDTRSETQGMEVFEKMVVTSRSKFLAIANTILRNREDAEDAVQDAFLSGYLHLPSFEGRSALTTWFTRIVLNAALMIRRRRKSAWMRSQPETSTSDDAGWMQRIPGAQPDPEMVYAEREAIQFVNEALGKMKPGLRQAFTMTYCDEMSGPEARALLGVSPAAFKSRLLRARRQLLNQVRRVQAASIRGATSSRADKNQFQPLAASQQQIGPLKVSLS